MVYDPFFSELDFGEDQRDFENMKEMYPETVRYLQELVEQECSRFEYAGSFMYDQYPDRITLDRMCERIVQAAQGSPAVEAMGWGHPPNRPNRPGRPPGPPPRPHMPPSSPIKDLVQVLLYNEIYRRRCNGRKCRRVWNFGL